MFSYNEMEMLQKKKKNHTYSHSVAFLFKQTSKHLTDNRSARYHLCSVCFQTRI